VPLSAVAEVRLATGPAEIRRANQERVAVISAAPIQGDLGGATAKAQEILAQTTLPVGIMGSVSGQSEEMTQSFRSLGLAFALAVFLVYLVMASQFESLLHPFVILFTIPMGLIGSIWGLYITGTTINSVALIGLIMLAGIVVNNAIVLIDAINQARERGLEKIEAIKLAGKTRLRPILITSVSTIIGLIPMAIGIGEGAEIRRPMAITVIAGNLVATFLTLIVIPVLYAVLDRKAYVKSSAGGTAALPLTTPTAAPPTRPPRAEPWCTPTSRLRRPVTTLMAFAAVAVIGIVSARLLPLEQYPDVSFPFMGAGVPYPGSTPEETEELITRPIEDALATLPGIEEIRSTSSDQDARFESASPGHGHQHRGIRSPQQAGLGAFATAEDRGPHVDVDGFHRRLADADGALLRGPGSVIAVRPARSLFQEAHRTNRRRGARRTRGRRGARSADPRGSGKAGRARRRRPPARDAAREEQLLRGGGPDHRQR
jgi:preprotein translocase subunit SecF